MKSWTRSLVAACALSLLAAGPTFAESTFPDRPIRLVVGAPPGGVNDTMARIISRQLEQRLGKPVIIDNKAGAGGTLAAEHVAKSTGDGYTLLVSNQSWAANPWIYRNLRYNTERELIPVAGLVTLPGIFAVNSSSPFKNLADVAAAAKAQPGKMTFASSGVGNAGHLGAELFQTVAGIEMNHIPYKGSMPAVTDLAGGQVDFILDFLPSLVSFFENDRLRPLAVSGSTRLPTLPDVPTITEAGFPSAEITAWVGVFAPAGVPEAIQRTVASAVAESLERKEVIDAFGTYGGVPLKRVGASFAAFCKDESKRWGDLIKRAGVPHQ